MDGVLKGLYEDNRPWLFDVLFIVEVCENLHLNDITDLIRRLHSLNGF